MLLEKFSVVMIIVFNLLTNLEERCRESKRAYLEYEHALYHCTLWGPRLKLRRTKPEITGNINSIYSYRTI